MPILRKQAHTQLLYTVEEEFPIQTANHQKAARRVTKEDNLITIEELVSNLMDKSRTQLNVPNLIISSVSKKPSKDNQSKSNTEELILKEPSRYLHYNGKHLGNKERYFYLHLELQYLVWRPYKKHILCINSPQEGTETTLNLNY